MIWKIKFLLPVIALILGVSGSALANRAPAAGDIYDGDPGGPQYMDPGTGAVPGDCGTAARDQYGAGCDQYVGPMHGLDHDSEMMGNNSGMHMDTATSMDNMDTNDMGSYGTGPAPGMTPPADMGPSAMDNYGGPQGGQDSSSMGGSYSGSSSMDDSSMGGSHSGSSSMDSSSMGGSDSGSSSTTMGSSSMGGSHSGSTTMGGSSHMGR